jgi:tRNA A37 methylthiotransferase MiaB
MKIKFLANYPPNAEIDHNRLRFSVNPSYFYLKHFYDLHGKNPNVEWQMADLFVLDDFDTIIANIEKNLPDILALSIFIWNETLQYNICKTIKERYPNVRIVAGGPQIVAHKNKDFFSQHPYIDYVVYGDGERAFQQIIDFESNLSTDKSNWVNIVENANSYTLYPFEQLVDQLYFTTSPILNQQQFVIDHIRDLENKGVPRNEMFFAVEFARGCMYNCSFCDWSQNLTKKVKRRSLNWREEINFWHQQNVAIRETDANFGQWNEDIEIFRYAMSLYDPNRNFKLIITNTPKLRKENTYEILKTTAENLGTQLKFSLQDINQDVLDKMERPSLSWDDHKSLIHKLRTNLDPKFHNLMMAELMVGVAGQTYDSFTDTIKRIIMETGIQNFFMNHWMLLPNSPGADPFYQRLHKIKWIKGYSVDKYHNINSVERLEDIYQEIVNGHGLIHGAKEGNYVFSTSTMTFAEIMAIHILQSSLIDLSEIKKILNSEPEIQTLRNIKNFESVFEKLKIRSLISAKQQFEEIKPLIDKYGVIVLGTYLPEKKQISYRWKHRVINKN